MACRNERKAKEAVRKIKEQTNNNKVIYKILDLSSFKSVRQFAADVVACEPRLDILVNNAGGGALPNELTEDGLPPAMQINYLSHFLLTNLLLGKFFSYYIQMGFGNKYYVLVLTEYFYNTPHCINQHLV